MGQLIIGILIFIIVAAVKSNETKRKKQAGHYGEHFPFPKTPENYDDKYDWYEENEQESANQGYHRDIYQSIDEIQVQSYDAVAPQIEVNIIAESNEDIENEYFEFDAEKAIIYSEIMNPKYID